MIYILTLWAGTAAACGEVPAAADGGGGEGMRRIVFALADSDQATRAAGSRVTRAADDPTENERRVERIDLFFFDDENSTPIYHPEQTQINYDNTTRRGSITIPEATYNQILDASGEDEKCEIYMIANFPDNPQVLKNKTLKQIKALDVVNAGGRMFNTGEAPSAFLMTGQTTSALTQDEGQSLGTITLKRAAAKITTAIAANSAIEGYTMGEASVRLENWLDKTLVDRQRANTTTDFQTTDWTPLSQALYSYSNDWNDAPENETSVTLALDWTRNETGQTETYYYRIPFSWLGAEGSAEEIAAHKGRIVRNHIYGFNVKIASLGGRTPEQAVTVEANFEIIDMVDRTIDVSVLEFHYLFVYEPTVELRNTATYNWEYRSSMEPTVEVVSVNYKNYAGSGTITTVEVATGDARYPQVDTHPGEGLTHFTVASAVPVNYVPLNITLRISILNGKLASEVRLTIYPGEYVTSAVSPSSGTGYYNAGAYNTPTGTNDTNEQWGSNNPTGGTGMKNFNFYRVTTVSINPRFIVLGSGEAQQIMLGDPTEPVTHPAYTEANPTGRAWLNYTPYNRTAENRNHIVSPDFIVASHRGITSGSTTAGRTWEGAHDRCARYREYPYPAGSWRVPTFAELALIAVMQRDPNSAVENLFVGATGASGTGWWTALPTYSILIYSYNPDTNAGVFGETARRSVRCVHDMWRGEGSTPF